MMFLPFIDYHIQTGPFLLRGTCKQPRVTFVLIISNYNQHVARGQALCALRSALFAAIF